MRRLVLLSGGFGRSRFSQRFKDAGFDVILCRDMSSNVLALLREEYDHITLIGDPLSYLSDIDSYILFSENNLNTPPHIPVLNVPGWWRQLLFSERIFLELWGWLTYQVLNEIGFDEPMGYGSKLKGILYESSS